MKIKAKLVLLGVLSVIFIWLLLIPVKTTAHTISRGNKTTIDGVDACDCTGGGIECYCITEFQTTDPGSGGPN